MRKTLRYTQRLDQRQMKMTFTMGECCTERELACDQPAAGWAGSCECHVMGM